MATTLEQVDEASLAKRLEEQKQLVARLVSEGKDASDANVTLYALGKALEDIRPREKRTTSNFRKPPRAQSP